MMMIRMMMNESSTPRYTRQSSERIFAPDYQVHHIMVKHFIDNQPHPLKAIPESFQLIANYIISNSPEQYETNESKENLRKNIICIVPEFQLIESHRLNL